MCTELGHDEVPGEIYGQPADKVISEHALADPFPLDAELLLAAWRCDPAGQRLRLYVVKVA